MISFDTETTGIDLKHGSSPFLVVIHDLDSDITTYWEWDVDPFTRKVQVNRDDLEQIKSIIRCTDKIVLHNSKFDVAAMGTLDKEFETDWPWEKTEDTLMMGHLLDSNKPHDLTSMCSQYLGLDISPLENKLKHAVQEARRIVRSKSFKEERGEWRIAEEGLPELPSCKETAWRNDYWLPKALDPDSSVLSDYAQGDALHTLALYQILEVLIRQEDLDKIYQERKKLLPIIQKMESEGVTLNKNRLDKLVGEYQVESESIANEMIEIAREHYQYDLTLPKSGSNKSLHGFCYEPELLNLPVMKLTKTGNQSLDSNTLSLVADKIKEDDPTGYEKRREYRFVNLLSQKRKRDTALNFMRSYKNFWKKIDNDNDDYVLFPSLNPTGTATLRFSSSKPNEQNISKKEGFNLRYAFGPAAGREWWSIDFENIELRIPAYESREEAMVELFEKPDEPPYFGSYHLLNCSIVYPDLFWPIADKRDEFKKRYKSTYYQWGKNGTFAIQYGCQEKKADSTFRRPGAYRTIKEKMPKVAALSQFYVDFANKYGYVETIPDKQIGSARGYPMKMQRLERGQISPTIPFSYHIQGTAMWCTAKAMSRCYDQLNRWNTLEPGADYRIVMQVHDEIDFDFPYSPNRGNYPKVLKLANLMRKSGEDIGVPLRVSISYHPNDWSKEE